MRRPAEWARRAWRCCRAAPRAPGFKEKARSSPVVCIVWYNVVGRFASQLLKRGGEGSCTRIFILNSPWPQTGEEKAKRSEDEGRAGSGNGGEAGVWWVQSSGVRNYGEGAEDIGGD